WSSTGRRYPAAVAGSGLGVGGRSGNRGWSGAPAFPLLRGSGRPPLDARNLPSVTGYLCGRWAPGRTSSRYPGPKATTWSNGAIHGGLLGSQPDGGRRLSSLWLRRTRGHGCRDGGGHLGSGGPSARLRPVSIGLWASDLLRRPL